MLTVPVVSSSAKQEVRPQNAPDQSQSMGRRAAPPRRFMRAVTPQSTARRDRNGRGPGLTLDRLLLGQRSVTFPLPPSGTKATIDSGEVAATSSFDDAGWSSPVAREAHNLEVAGSNPVPATCIRGFEERRPAG